MTGTGAASPITVTGLTNGVSYTFTATATNSAGTGPASGVSNSITPASPQTITFNNPGAQNYGTTPTLMATSDSGLTVLFSSSTTGVCTITSGGAVSFVTSGTCTINADQPGDSSYLPATQVSRSFTVNAVAPGAPAMGTASTAGAGQARVTFAAPATNGGAAITGYTVTSSPGGLTQSGSASPLVVNGLDQHTSYTFTVTATNSAGTGAASSASNAITPSPAPLAKAVSATVDFGAPATRIALDIDGTPTSVAVASAPSHGQATVNGTEIGYQPNPGYAGADSFTYTASDAAGTSAPATVSVTVSAPTLTLGPNTLPTATASNSYTQQLAGEGGTAPYSYALTTGALPSGLTLTTGGVLSGTPTIVGSYNFTVMVTDSSSGTGPFTASRAYSLMVRAATVTIEQSSLPQAPARKAIVRH